MLLIKLIVLLGLPIVIQFEFLFLRNVESLLFFGDEASLLLLHLLALVGLELVFEEKFVVHDLFFGLELDCFAEEGGLLAFGFAIEVVLEAKVEVQEDFARVFGFEAEAVHDVGVALFVKVLGADHLLHFMNPDGAT